MIRSSIYFIRTKIFLLDIMEIRLVFHKFNQNNKTSSHLVVYKHLFCRLFMLISLKTVLNHWKKGKPWTWHILFNGFQQMLHFHGVLIFTWTTLSLSTRWLLVRNAGWIAHLLSFVNWSDLLSPLKYTFRIYYRIRGLARRNSINEKFHATSFDIVFVFQCFF